jgi:23S rRNA-/tRNA-specific pseudouridylate synthase
VTGKLQKNDAIGFPPPLLGESPQRLRLLAETADWLALDKPAGAGTRAHPWDETPDLDDGLNVQLDAGKPELQKTGASLFASVYYLDPEISGVALFAKNREALAGLRNCFGSGELQFTFRFLAADHPGLSPEVEADAPLLPHRVKPKMIPSTARGKKCRTIFTRLSRSELGWALWEAKACFLRPHQVRAHAAVQGIPVLGDALYGGPAAPTVRQLQPRARRSDLDSAVFQGLAIHLARIELSGKFQEFRVQSDLPKPFALLLKRLACNSQPTTADQP